MPIKFNFSPAGLAAILASTAGLNDAEREAIQRAQQQQQSDRDFQLRSQQQAMQDDQNQFDNVLKARDLQGRLANIYADNQRQDRTEAGRSQDAAAKNQLQRDELTQRQKFQDEGNAIRRDDLTRKDAADQASQDLAQKKLAQQADHWSQVLDSRNRMHDQDVAQRDAESERKTQLAVQKMQVTKVKVDPVQAKRFGEAIDGAKAQYQQSREAMNTYLNELRTGAVMDSMDVQNTKVQQLQTTIEESKKRVNAAHDQYDSYLENLAGASAPATPPPTVAPSAAAPASTPGAGYTATGPNGQKIRWNGGGWEPYAP